MILLSAHYIHIMSILETSVHYLDSKRLQKLTGFISRSSPSFGSLLHSCNPPISSRQKLICGCNDIGETAPLIRLRIAARITRRDLPGLPPAFRTASDKSWAWRPGNLSHDWCLTRVCSHCTTNKIQGIESCHILRRVYSTVCVFYVTP